MANKKRSRGCVKCGKKVKAPTVANVVMVQPHRKGARPRPTIVHRRLTPEEEKARQEDGPEQ